MWRTPGAGIGGTPFFILARPRPPRPVTPEPLGRLLLGKPDPRPCWHHRDTIRVILAASQRCPFMHSLLLCPVGASCNQLYNCDKWHKCSTAWNYITITTLFTNSAFTIAHFWSHTALKSYTFLWIPMAFSNSLLSLDFFLNTTKSQKSGVSKIIRKEMNTLLLSKKAVDWSEMTVKQIHPILFKHSWRLSPLHWQDPSNFNWSKKPVSKVCFLLVFIFNERPTSSTLMHCDQITNTALPQFN